MSGNSMNIPSAPSMAKAEDRSYLDRKIVALDNLRLWANKQITDEEYQKLDEMIQSPDYPTLVIADESIKSLSKMREKGYYQGVNIIGRVLSDIINTDGDQQTDGQTIDRIVSYLKDLRIYTPRK